jgi:hypothetical protein
MTEAERAFDSAEAERSGAVEVSTRGDYQGLNK